jgi:hypothetical protein
MCIKGKGIGPGANALRARWGKTEESLHIEYSITGSLKAAAVSLKISRDSFSRASSTEGDGVTDSIVVYGVFVARVVWGKPG